MMLELLHAFEAEILKNSIFVKHNIRYRSQLRSSED